MCSITQRLKQREFRVYIDKVIIDKKLNNYFTMRKFLSFLALTLLFTACQNEHKQEADGTLVDVKLYVSAEDVVTRAEGATGYSSALGAIVNFNDADWQKYDLRYIFEVYDVDDNGSGVPVTERQIRILDKYTDDKEVFFNIRLTSYKSYKFVVFADIVNQGEQSDLYYNTTDLRKISMMEGKTNPMDEARDAYFASEKVTFIESENVKSIKLKRPFGKVRVVAEDYDYVASYAAPAKAKVTYYNCELFSSFNAVSGSVSSIRPEKELIFEYNLAKSGLYTAGLDADEKNMTLFADYLLAIPTGESEVNFTLSLWDENDNEIIGHDFNKPIPIERNHLTTIKGNLLTTSATIKVTVNHTLNDNGNYKSEVEYPYNQEQ